MTVQKNALLKNSTNSVQTFTAAFSLGKVANAVCF